MPKSMKKRKTIDLPRPHIASQEQSKITLPYNGTAVSEKSLSFSFACFDRSHELFNLGDKASIGGVVSGRWFLDLMDCLKNISNKNISELRGGTYDLHPIDWKNTNTSPPDRWTQLEYSQFRINKSRGRVIGFILGNIFYIVWLDPHHNLTDSEGYGKAIKYKPPQSEYEMLSEENRTLTEQLLKTKKDLEEFLLK